MAKSLYGSIERLRNFPIDESSRFEKFSQAMNYCLFDKTAYKGQMVSIYNDDNKSIGGENKNGIYIVIDSSETESGLTLLRATDSDAIDRLTTGLEELSNDFVELEEKLGEDIENKLQSFATKDELDDVSDKIEKLIGLTDGESLNEALDTIKEISDWILEHEVFVTTILDINERLNLIKAQNEMLSANLNNTSNIVSGLVSSVNQLYANDYISKQDARALVQNSSYGYRRVSFTGFNSKRIYLPIESLIIDKINIFIESSAPDAYFKLFVRDLDTNISTILISNDDDDEELTNYIDTTEMGNFLYNINTQISPHCEVWYEISYDNEHDPSENLRGSIGVSFYNIL